MHVFDRWTYLGTVHDQNELPELLAQAYPAFDLQMMKLVRSVLKKRASAVISLAC